MNDRSICPLHCCPLDEDDLDIGMYNGFANEDINVRSSTYTSLYNTFCAWLDGYGSPTVPRHLNSFISPIIINDTDGHQYTNSPDNLEFISMIKDHIPTLHCLSKQCPIDDVRSHCTKLLNMLEARGIALKNGDDASVGPSWFIPVSEVVPVNTQNDKTKLLFTQAYLQNSRLDHLTQIMGYHPQYLTCFLRTQNILLREEGPLPYHYRHYIAIIAAARHQCTYLAHLHTSEYLRCGGDRSWLESINNVPAKLRNLQEINRLLAHRPWLVNSQHIEKLCRCGSNSWSLSELTHAIVLMAHFHSLCSAIYGCGINFELDDSAGRLLHSDGESNSDSDNESISSEQAQLDGLLERLKKLNDETETEYSEEEGQRRFETVESQTAEYSVQDKSKPVHCMSHRTCNISHMIEQPEYTYADFIKFKETNSTFRASDYSWETHGYSIANRFYTDIGIVLDEKFTTAKEFTYYTIGEKYTGVNTQDFRTGIWNYIHCIMGIRHDDYDYAKVNSLLERNLKSFIKFMTCYPEKLTRKDFDGVMKGFTYSEKIHVSIILLEARMQAELLYALRAVSQFMT